jgi:adenylate cyclase
MKAILRKRRHAVLRFVVVGSVVGALVGLLIHQIELGPPLPHALRGAAAGFLIGGILGVGEEFVFIGRYRWRAYMILNALRISLYVTALLAALIIVNAADTWLTQETGFVEAVRLYVVGDTMGRDSIFAIVVAILGTSFLEIRKLHNSGDLRRYLMGVYRYPEAEDRVFLFADLQDSTGLAERLGDLAYTRLIGDCYRDMSEAILAWRGQVYQYVGDEVIVSWPFDKGTKNASCIRCFFDMEQLLEGKARRYMRRYGTIPKFRAGIHGGSVLTVWVGEAKTELAFFGDTLNAVSRIQGHCKALNERCLVSATVLEQLDLPSELRAKSLGEAELRGKDELIELFALERAVPRRPRQLRRAA